MNIEMFKSSFNVNIGPAQTPVGVVERSPAERPDAITPNKARPSNTPKADRSDNSPPVTQDESVTESSETFGQTLGKKIKPKISQDAQPGKKTEKLAQNPGAPSRNMVLACQNALTQPAVLDKEICTKANDHLQKQAEVQASPKPKTTQPVSVSESAQALPLIAQVAKAVTANSDQIAPVAAENSKQLGESTNPVINRAQVRSAPIVPITANETPISGVQTANGKDVGKPQLSDNPVVTNKQIAINNEAPASEKPVGKSTPVDSYGMNTSGKSEIAAEPIPDLGDSSESIRKMFIGDQSPQAQQKSPAPSADSTAQDKSDTGQKNHSGKTEIFESPENNNTQAEPFSVRSMVQKASQAQAAAPQVEDRNNLFVHRAANPDIEVGEQVHAGNNVQSGNTEQLAIPVASMNVARNANSDVTVSQQIQESVQSSLREGTQQIVIRLDPPELGKVAITFTEKGDDIVGVLQVDKLQTRNQIQQELPEIIQNLQNSGVQIKKLEVVLTNQQEQHTSREQSSTAGQGSFAEHQNSSNHESQTNNTTYNEWMTYIENGTGFNETQAYITDKSVNMLV